MRVLIVSQCSKNALKETRRIIDQFAERCGDRTWQTHITQQGLDTLRKLLKKSARKNTAVACHWIRGGISEHLLWIIGDVSQFNEQGTIPTNRTQQDILKVNSESGWNTAEDIELMAGIAGLFHDFGKANTLFQDKLNPNKKFGIKSYEPFRHEWVSLRLFTAFVNGQTDEEWLKKMSLLKRENDEFFLASLIKDQPPNKKLHKYQNPFIGLPPFALVIAWLILSHHRLPVSSKYEDPPPLEKIDEWIESSLFRPDWNSPQVHEKWSDTEFEKIWKFPHGTPVRSATWRKKAKVLSLRALKRVTILTSRDWIKDAFSMHLARLVLMLADHHYSSLNPYPKWQDKSYGAFANTDRKLNEYKQKLDEHVVGVAENACFFGRTLPMMRNFLPSITRHSGFKKRVKDSRYRWQDKSYELVVGLKRESEKRGFFGVNLASTGCGKTFANARIMYGLSNDRKGCRFSIALGLRTLTLQTGDALQERLRINEEDLAVLLGSQAIRELHEKNNPKDDSGSESTEDLLGNDSYVRYEGALDDSPLNKWLKKHPELQKLVSAPILVSTIDQLIGATEGGRGGRQIAPMLRLLTSDLVLDEPDDYGLADLPALCRLVHWAGLLGSRVLISSATLPPTLVEAMFDAYRCGREIFQKAYCNEETRNLGVCCAWFDENKVKNSNHSDKNSFSNAHSNFVLKRVESLKEQPILRRARLADVSSSSAASKDVVVGMADTLHREIHLLHTDHAVIHNMTKQKISVGLVRMANINPLVAVAKELLQRVPHKRIHIHYCIYHSRFPLVIRSFIEKSLDELLTRHDKKSIWKHQVVKQALLLHPDHEHIFVVLASPIAEVGRDHDYDWAIVEPSSMRSIIQIAGRIQRHRQNEVEVDNLVILERNFQGLQGKEKLVFAKPGFESQKCGLNSVKCSDLLEQHQYQVITSIPRIFLRKSVEPNANLSDFEHFQTKRVLFGDEKPKFCYAALWWNHDAHWCYELQKLQGFRKGEPDIEYVQWREQADDEDKFGYLEENGTFKEEDFQTIDLDTMHGNSIWGGESASDEIMRLVELFNIDLQQACRRFGVFRLPERNDRWLYHPQLGFHQELR